MNRCLIALLSLSAVISACAERDVAAAQLPGGPAKSVAPQAVAAADKAQDGVRESPHVCNHADNPACAVDIDPKIAAEHGPAQAMTGEKYGQGVTLAQSVAISEVAANPEKFVGQRVRIEGQVDDVCKMAGCWFTIKGDVPGKTMKFKVTDGVMVFPTSAVGKYAVAEGTVRKMQLDLETTKKVMAHEAQEQGKPFDPASVKEPMTIVRIDGLGAVIRDKK